MFGVLFRSGRRKINTPGPDRSTLFANDTEVLPFQDEELQHPMALSHTHLFRTLGVHRSLFGSVYLCLEEGEHMPISERVDTMTELETASIFKQAACAAWYLIRNGWMPIGITVDSITLVSDVVKLRVKKIKQFDKFVTGKYSSRSYASPEALRDVPYIADKAVVWSLGICLHILLTGSEPTFPYAPPDSVSIQAQVLLVRMLDVDCMERVTMAQVCKDAWFTGHVVGRVRSSSCCIFAQSS